MQGPRPITPLRAALYAVAITLLVGTLVGLLGILIVNPGGSPEARGERFGAGLGRLTIVIAVITYLAVRRRRKRDGR